MVYLFSFSGDTREISPIEIKWHYFLANFRGLKKSKSLKEHYAFRLAPAKSHL